MNEIMTKVIEIVRESGTIVLNHYRCLQESSTVFKEDGSPLTLADRAANEFIVSRLKQAFPWAVLSEEDPVDYSVRKNWDYFWLVDPLDGTKDFIAANDEFTINVALIHKGEPILGVIYAPALDELYYAQKGEGATLIKNEEACELPKSYCKLLKTARSRFHDSEMFYEFLKLNNIAESFPCGSALKFGRLASGEINLYPRFVGSSEWDIAAGHIVLKEAGCKIIDLKTFCEPHYNKISIRNNYFIACSSSVNIFDFILPKGSI